MTTPEYITELKDNEVFVFGSNKAGQHDGGAAKVAYDKFGAIYGIGHGLVGQSYAFPTLGKNLEKLDELDLKHAVTIFKYTVMRLPAVTFYLTKVGCGIAGYPEEDMKKLFINTPPNVIKPEGW